MLGDESLSCRLLHILDIRMSNMKRMLVPNSGEYYEMF